MSKIGIGVITMGIRPIHSNVTSKSRGDAIFRVQTDHNREGPAATRNRCLKFLMDQGCDHFFMFDDDCYPIHDGYEDYFISEAQRHDVHFLGLPEAFKSHPTQYHYELVYWDSIIGCFSYQTRKFMETVGYYNNAYKRYGYEDAARNRRAIRAGMTGQFENFPSLLRAPSYIFSEDVYGHSPTPNLSMEEKMQFIEINKPIWKAENESKQVFYPYAES